MHKLKIYIIILCLFFTGIGFTSCSDDTVTSDDNSFANVFSSLKSDYKGNVTLIDNTVVPIKFKIVDDLISGVVFTDVRVSEFPMKNIIYKLYPTDYNSIKITSQDDYVAPLDSVGFLSSSIMNFKTDNSHTSQLNFTFTKDGAMHTGWAQISTTGIFYASQSTLQIVFTVTDLVVDNEDKSSLCTGTNSISYTTLAEKVQ